MAQGKPADILKCNLKTYLGTQKLWNEDLETDVPKHWERREDLIILKSGFENPIWKQIEADVLWGIVCKSLKCSRLAKRVKICDDDFRTPSIVLLKGQTGWVTHVDNGIKYTWDVTKCMFSAGNITEKLRIAKFNCQDEVVVDLFSGIGYFTLPYLIHAKAKFVHACEWNPNAIEALKRNIILNKVEDRCVVYEGDNRLTCPSNVADRVNLGLIPTSEGSWQVACEALRRDRGGILHIHDNIDYKKNGYSTSVGERSKNVCEEIMKILTSIWNCESCVEIIDVVKVKSYAPHVMHVVLDVRCTPK